MTIFKSARLLWGGVTLGLTGAPAAAQEMEVSFTIPRLKVAEYHRPYVAIWIENSSGNAVSTLDAWYDTGSRREDGRKWLADMRSWWRKAGRRMEMPVDGISGPTQGPGQHRVSFANDRLPLGSLAPGDYRLRIEVVREVGGREVVTIPFTWPPAGPPGQAKRYSAKGKMELGSVVLTVKP